MPDSYVSQFSGEEIDSAVRAAQIISGASTPAELREKLEIRGDNIPVSAEDSTLISEALTKIPTTSGGGVNPNLLDNWYFGRPVNQRGQTELANGNWNMYFIDRWISAAPECAYTITDDGIKISNLQHKYNQIWVQNLEQIEKRTYTLSFLLKNIGLLSLTFTPQGSDYTEQTLDGGFIVSFTSEADLANPKIRLLDSASVTVSDVTLLAAKLELGDTQTLAHKENDKWVLNEIPDFGEQLARCQRYAVELNRLNEEYPMLGMGQARTSTLVSAIVNIPPMRVRPTLTTDVTKWTVNNQTQYITPTAVNVNAMDNNCMQLFIDASGLTPGLLYEVYLWGHGKAFLSADL